MKNDFHNMVSYFIITNFYLLTFIILMKLFLMIIKIIFAYDYMKNGKDWPNNFPQCDG
jgi:hypothetical protein